MGPGHYPHDDAANRMGESRFRLPGEIRGVDPRRKIASAGFSWIAGGQKADGSGARDRAMIALVHRDPTPDIPA